MRRLDDNLQTLLDLRVVTTAVLMRELVDVLPGFVSIAHVDYPAAYLNVARWLIVVDNANRYTAVAGQLRSF